MQSIRINNAFIHMQKGIATPKLLLSIKCLKTEEDNALRRMERRIIYTNSSDFKRELLQHRYFSTKTA